MRSDKYIYFTSDKLSLSRMVAGSQVSYKNLNILKTGRVGTRVYKSVGQYKDVTREIEEDFAVGQTVKTHDGRDARILCLDLKQKSGRPILAAVASADRQEGLELLFSYTTCGDNLGPISGINLVKNKRTVIETVFVPDDE